MSSKGQKPVHRAPPWSGRRLWVARLAVLLGGPALLLLVAESGLRVIGYGEPTTYFLPVATDPGRLVENPAFARRFFPPGLLRVPPPTTFRTAKAPGTLRVFLFGESAAMGDPKPGFGVARFLEVLLRERFPGTAFEVIPVAMTAINSHALLPMARECARLDGDLWVVYAGNNEMLGPFGAGTVLGRQAPPWRIVRLILTAKATRVGQAIESLWQSLRGGTAEGSDRWTGVQVLANESVASGTSARERVYTAFRRNLEDIVQAGQGAGAQVLLSSVAVNLRDSAPFGSAHRPELQEGERASWDQWVAEGLRALTNGEPSLALEALTNAVVLDDRPAELFFQIGTSLLAQGQEGAKAPLARARDLDTVPLRADGRLNAIVQEVATAQRTLFVDADQALSEASARGIPGWDFFYEHVHLTPEGNYALARAFADALLPALPEKVRAEAPTGAWASREECETRLALTPWARSAAAEQMLARCLDAPFSRQWNHAAHLETLAGEVARQRRNQTPASATFIQGVFTNALAAAPDDPHLHRAYAEFLEATGGLAEAAAEWATVRKWFPDHPVAYLREGSLLRRLRRFDEARPLIERAGRLQPEWVEVPLELGELALAEQKPEEAIRAFQAALHLQPNRAATYLRLAAAQAGAKQPDAVLTSLKEAVRLDPDLWEARYFLGVEHAVRDQVADALVQFSAAVRLKPDHAPSQFNFGIALARQQRWAEAAQHLSESLRLDPQNEQAKQALAQVILMGRANPNPQTPSPPSDP